MSGGALTRGLCELTLETRDMNASLTFYRDVLGFSVTQDVRMGDYRWLSVSTIR